MCKYLLKRKFPRDIYSWFITSYIWGCLDSIPGAEFFSRCTESILHSFVFRAASANRKESVVGEKRTCLSRQNTSLLYKHLHVSTKKKKYTSLRDQDAHQWTSRLRFTRLAHLWMHGGSWKDGAAGSVLAHWRCYLFSGKWSCELCRWCSKRVTLLQVPL